MSGLEETNAAISSTVDIGSQTDAVIILPVEDSSRIDTSTQTEYTKYELQAKIETMILRNEANTYNTSKSVAHDPSLLNLDAVKHDDTKMKFFTGLTYQHFMALIHFLGPCVNNLKYWNRKSGKPANHVSPPQELFITLVRLRRAYCFQTMQYLFKLSPTTIRCIFTTWLQLLYCHFDSMRDRMFPVSALPSPFQPFKIISFESSTMNRRMAPRG